MAAHWPEPGNRIRAFRRFLPRGETQLERIACEEVDTLVQELEEFAGAVRGTARPEMDGEKALNLSRRGPGGDQIGPRGPPRPD